MNYVLSIGDIHGREEWKTALFGSPTAHAQWEVESRNHGIGAFMADVYPIGLFDKVIFVGDYVDSFDKMNVEIKLNLEHIIYLKQIFPEKVILLLGNHDIQYKDGEKYYCSGYRPEMKYDLYDLFNTKIGGKSIFQAAFQHGSYLWTHAGVTRGFQVDCLEGFRKILPTSAYAEMVKAEEIPLMNEADLLNLMYEVKHPDIFRVSFARGGWTPIPGIFWADKKELHDKPATGVNQIVGHTRINRIKIYQFHRESKSVGLHFIDNLEDNGGEFLVTDFSNEKAVRSLPLYIDRFESLDKLKQSVIPSWKKPEMSNEETLRLVGDLIKDKMKRE